VLTRAGGLWSFKAKPVLATTYTARWTTASSRALTVGVQPRVSVEVLSDGRISTAVVGGRTFAGSTVQLQRLTSGQWRTLSRQKLGLTSGAVFAEPMQAGSATIRIAMSVNQTGFGYLGTTSHPLVYHAYSLTLAPSSFAVTSGNAVTLSGRLVNASPGQPIAVEAWPYGRSAPITIATARTGSDGRWSVRTRPTIMTTYLAHWGSVTVSSRRTVGAKPEITVNELSGSQVFVSVFPARSFAGRMVELQTWSPQRGWHSVVKGRLGGESTAIFKVPFPVIQIRIAMSVNQAGAGYLGATSHSFVLH
jgi:hypothetical protein